MRPDSKSPAACAEPEFTIEPLLGWRTWAVSTLRPWEEGPPSTVLRGAWGRPWTSSRLTARCLLAPIKPSRMIGGLIKIVQNREANRHSTSAPEPGCTCGIYAEKADLAGQGTFPRLTRLPQASGPVELSGMVIEGTRGYRAQHAQILGPLELRMPCAGTVDFAEPCPNPSVEVLTLDDTSQARCAEHTSGDISRSRLPLRDWLDVVVPGLQATYGTPVFTFEKGGTHGHW